MATETARPLGRSMKDVTRLTADDLRGEITPHLAEKREFVDPAKGQVISIASGKGGTGKTVVTTNLAVLLARMGLKVILFDADLGLANAHLLLGVSPEHDIAKVISGEMKLGDVIVEGEAGVKLIPGGSGFSEFSDLDDGQIRRLMDQLKIHEDASDIMLVDLSAGISPQVMRFLNASHDVIIVTTPDVTAMLDAYATIKALAGINRKAETKIIVNCAKDRRESVETFKKIAEVASKHLGEIGASFLGWVPENWYVEDSVFKRHPVCLLHPKCLATACLKSIAERILAGHGEWVRKRDAGEDIASFSSTLKCAVFE